MRAFSCLPTFVSQSRNSSMLRRFSAAEHQWMWLHLDRILPRFRDDLAREIPVKNIEGQEHPYMSINQNRNESVFKKSDAHKNP